jgi:intracellular sulfur oxidation DsrE/DsrF family protein
MKKYWSMRTIFTWGILLALVFAAIAPATTASAASAQAVLKVTNRSDTTLKLWLTGPARYTISVPAGKTKTYDVVRGSYKFTGSVCGITATGTLDVSINRNLVMPPCGGKVTSSDVHTIDLGQFFRVVKVEVKNQSTGVATVVFKGPAVYMLTLKKNADNFYTMAKGKYIVTVYACGETVKKNFTADNKKKFVVTCP